MSDEFMYENGKATTETNLLFSNFKTHVKVKPKGLFVT
jgi:hypothetical protein